ncbi:MAG: ATP-binding protein [Candidatus Woesearchaeota archaeon]
MDKELLIKVLEEWNFWNKDISKQVGRERAYTKEIEKFLPEREIITLSGPRRAGKSTIMYQFIQKISQSGGMDQILYINFEEPAFLPYLSTDLLEQIYDTYRENINPDKKSYLFLDEVQNIPAWEKWVRSYYDKKEDVKFIITGSSSKLLGSEFSSLLTGRFVNFEIFPLSFKEFLEFRGFEIPAKILKESERKIRFYLKEYLQFGSFPEIVLKDDETVKIKVLEQYFESMLMRDVVERYQIRDVLSLKQAAVFGLTNISKEFSYNTLRKSLKVSLESAKNYSFYLEQAFILLSLPFFSYSMKEVMARNRKLYAIDTGIRNAISKSFAPDLGRLAENVVYLHLRRKTKEIHYWKEKGEVDFVVKDTVLVPINVTIGKSTPKREKRSLLDFLDKFKLKEAVLITDNEEGEETENGKTIRKIPLWRWLLSQ